MSNPVQTQPTKTTVVLAFGAVYLIWGSTYLAIRVAVETMPPFAMAAIRFLIAGTLLFAFLKLRGAPWPSPRQWRINAVIGTFLLLGGNGLVVWAEQTIPSGITALLIGATPLCIVLTEWAWPGGSRPNGVTMGAMLLGFAGVAWLAAPWESSADGGLSFAGVAALLGATLFWSIGSIYSRHARHDADPFMASALQMLGGSAALMGAAVFSGDFNGLEIAAIPARAWASFVYLIAFGSLVGFSAFVWLMKHCAPARVATYAYVNPVVAVFLGWILLGEPVGPRTVTASLIIVTAVAIVTMQKTRAAPTTAAAK